MKDAGLDLSLFNVKHIEELSKSYTWVRYPDMSQRFYSKKDITEMLLVIAKEIYIWVKKKFENN